jgi:hypothetical protein
MLRVYLAASSDELQRAAAWMDRVRAARGLRLTHDWVAVIRAVGVANPANASRLERQVWAAQARTAIVAADVVWMLAPLKGHGRGAYFECGLAHGLERPLLVSGPSTQSVFGALAEEFTLDSDAFERLVALADLRAMEGEANAVATKD